MTTDEYGRWQATTVRRPDDVPAATPLSWHVKKVTEHNDRLMNNALPTDFKYDVERGDAEDAIAVLALQESMRRVIEHDRGGRVHEALRLGATWRQVADALDIHPDEARAILRDYADGQRRLWLSNEKDNIRPFGLSADQHTAVLALLELGDDESTARSQ